MKPGLSLGVVLATTVAASGQGFSRPPGVSPTITPAMLPAAVPALRFPAPFGIPVLGNPAAAPPFLGYRRFGFAPAFGPAPGFGYPPLYGYGYNNFIGPRLGPDLSFGGVPQLFPPVAPPLVGTQPVVTAGPTTDSALTAQVTVVFPVEVELKVDGRPDATKGVTTATGVERTLTTRPLRPGETVTLTISAAWTQDGKPIEWDRELTLSRGETARLKVARGFLKR